MKRANLFLAVLIASIVALVATTVVGFSIYSTTPQTSQNPNGWMSQMWNGAGTGNNMMGQSGAAASTSTFPYFALAYALLISVTAVGIIGLAYYTVYPQMRMCAVPATPSAATPAPAYESVAKTLTEEERQVIKTINAHNGKYLQKYIKNETGLSRLKTHRIIARLAERGIVTLEKTGNTNQVYLANWLNNKTQPKAKTSSLQDPNRISMQKP
jgi:uncharacterized membrane protein